MEKGIREDYQRIMKDRENCNLFILKFTLEWVKDVRGDCRICLEGEDDICRCKVKASETVKEMKLVVRKRYIEAGEKA